MKEPKPRSDRAFQLDQWLAAHQKHCWIILAALALIGAAVITYRAPKNTSTVLSIALAIGLMLLYTWVSNAPVRAIREWVRRLREETDHGINNSVSNQGFLDFLLLLEKTLPSLRRKELAFTIVQTKASALYHLGRKEEALALLRSFNQIWDPRQKEILDELIQKISGEAERPENEPKEQP